MTITYECEDCGASSSGTADTLKRVERIYGVLLCGECRRRVG